MLSKILETSRLEKIVIDKNLAKTPLKEENFFLIVPLNFQLNILDLTFYKISFLYQFSFGYRQQTARTKDVQKSPRTSFEDLKYV